MALARQDLLWTGDTDIRDYTIAVAREVLREEQAKGFDKDPRVIVDRRFDAPVETVKPFGKIEFVRNADLTEIVDWIFKEIVENSPIGNKPKTQPRYYESHMILVDGQEVDADRLKTIRPGDRIQIVNTQPYAKKIEGRDRGRGGAAEVAGQSVQAPNGVYRMVFKEAERLYGRNAFLQFTYVKLNTGVRVWKHVNYYTRKDGSKSAGSYTKVDMVYPCIKIHQAP